MAKYGSSSFSVLLLNGINLLAAKVKNVTHKTESITEPTHGLGDSSEENTPVGMTRVLLTQDGAFFDTGTNSIHDALKTPSTVSRILCFAVSGNVIGKGFSGCYGVLVTTYEALATIATLTKANVSYVLSGDVEDGIIVQSHTQKSIDWNTKTDGQSVDYALDVSQRGTPITSNSVANPTVVTTAIPHGLTTGDIVLISGVAASTPTINGERVATVTSPTTFTVPLNVTVPGTGGAFVRANSSYGGVGYLHVSQFAGLTGFVGKLRDSTDNVTFADLIAFTNVTAAPASQRVEVAGVVDRYLSFDGDVTGTGTVTPFAGFSRG